MKKVVSNLHFSCLSIRLGGQSSITPQSFWILLRSDLFTIKGRFLELYVRGEKDRRGIILSECCYTVCWSGVDYEKLDYDEAGRVSA